MAAGEGSEVSRNRKFQRGIMVVTSAELTYQLTGSNMSSPQTAELNANARAPTIDKWVRITHWEAVMWNIFLVWLYGSFWPLLGGALSWSGMYAKYRHAISSGKKSSAPPTENYQNPAATKGPRRQARPR